MRHTQRDNSIVKSVPAEARSDWGPNRHKIHAPALTVDADKSRLHEGIQVSPVSVARILWVAMIFFASPLSPQEAGVPFPEDERLRYMVAWPSGLGFGSAEFHARQAEPGWRFEMKLQASLPEMEIDDAFRSRANTDLCSSEFQKHVRHGKKRAHELLRFGPTSVERTNLDTELREDPGTVPVNGCTRDALVFLYHLRRDLASGRIPPATEVFFGAGYRVAMEYAQTRWLAWNGERRLSDEITLEVRGPASKHAFAIHFGRDAARTPLLFRVEFEGEQFTMRLVE